MDIELQVQMKNDPVDIQPVTAKNGKELQDLVNQLVQDCKHVESIKINDMEEFATSLRGRFLMNEVIQYGLTVMESLPDRERADSDIRDIKFIRDTIFKWK